MKITIEDSDGFHKSDPGTRMDMLLMALKKAGYQLRGKPMPSWGCEEAALLSPYQCGNNWMPVIVSHPEPTQEEPLPPELQSIVDTQLLKSHQTTV